LFKPEELAQIVVGEEELDFEALKQQTMYDGGYSATSPSIQ
jgi:hypothetical protein